MVGDVAAAREDDCLVPATGVVVRVVAIEELDEGMEGQIFLPSVEIDNE